MSKELEFAAADSVAALTRRGRAAKPSHTHTECLNCDAPLQGPYCYNCGQNADDHHRSIVHLTWEAIEGFTHLDGRLARTVPALLLRPGKLATSEPFRLYTLMRQRGRGDLRLSCSVPLPVSCKEQTTRVTPGLRSRPS